MQKILVTTRLAVSADILAAGLVAAGREFGIDPRRVMEPRVPHAARARIAVASALISMHPGKSTLGLKVAAARVLCVGSNKLAPSGLKAASVTMDHLSVIADAMRAAGLPRQFASRVETAVSPIGVPAPAPTKASSPPPPPLRRTVRVQDAVPVRLPDVVYSETSGKPLDLGAGDATLVAACLAQGGFPRALALPDGRAVWLNAENKPWRFAGPKRTRPKALEGAR